MDLRPVTMSVEEVRRLAFGLLVENGLGTDQADAVAKVIAAGERDACHSHGVYRIPGCVRAVRSGKLATDAVPVIQDGDGPIVRVDAGFGFSCLAFDRVRATLTERARRFGLAALAINNCFHFSALWPEVEALAANGLVALAMTPSHSWVAPAGGAKPVFGTNPIAFAWPRPGDTPYVFDFATSETARGEIELRRQNGQSIPAGWAVDPEGKPTTDADAALAGAMLAFGGHKGSALSTMVELLAGALVGDRMSFESREFDDGFGIVPCHGELVLAFSPERMMGGEADGHLQRAEGLFERVIDAGARLPSQRRFDARKRAMAEGVSISRRQFDLLEALRVPRGQGASRPQA